MALVQGARVLVSKASLSQSFFIYIIHSFIWDRVSLPWLSWNSLCIPGWPRTQKSTWFCLPNGCATLPGVLDELFFLFFKAHFSPSCSGYRWLWATMWFLRFELMTSSRAIGALNRWAISPAGARASNAIVSQSWGMTSRTGLTRFIEKKKNPCSLEGAGGGPGWMALTGSTFLC
jgi:hypothetical protein